jgi:hypothetical protein
LPVHFETAVFREYQYVSHDATSVTYDVEISSLSEFDDGTDLEYSIDAFKVEGEGTFEIISNEVVEAAVFDNAATVLLMDQSGLLEEIDPYNNRTKAINKFLEDFSSPNIFLFGGFSKSGGLAVEPVEYSSTDFTSVWDQQNFLYALVNKTGGVSSLLDALDNAIDKLSTSSKSNRNLVALVHAADAGSAATVSAVITKAILNNVKIHVLVFGTEDGLADDWELAEQTGGMLVMCPSDGEVISVFDHLERLFHQYSSINKVRIEFTPTGGVVSGNTYENRISITSSRELNPVYVKVKIP